mmetsp:Transcript_8603/g.8941  ORF Transcript_8603/g.8941 Transcript_8603/m.8941 type:complete len:327 (-) Transcript_8603:423-1403(-)
MGDWKRRSSSRGLGGRSGGRCRRWCRGRINRLDSSVILRRGLSSEGHTLGIEFEGVIVNNLNKAVRVIVTLRLSFGSNGEDTSNIPKRAFDISFIFRSVEAIETDLVFLNTVISFNHNCNEFPVIIGDSDHLCKSLTFAFVVKAFPVSKEVLMRVGNLFSRFEGSSSKSQLPVVYLEVINIINEDPAVSSTRLRVSGVTKGNFTLVNVPVIGLNLDPFVLKGMSESNLSSIDTIVSVNLSGSKLIILVSDVDIFRDGSSSVTGVSISNPVSKEVRLRISIKPVFWEVCCREVSSSSVGYLVPYLESVLINDINITASLSRRVGVSR